MKLHLYISAIFLALAVFADAQPGTLDTVFDVLKTVDQNVSASAIQGDGRIIISGQFTTYNGLSSNRIVRLMDDGTLDASFNVGTGADGTISEVVLQSDGKILICGDFTSYNGTTRNRIARLNADGSIDASFNPGAGATDNVYTMVLQADGKIIIGGSFISFDGTTSRRIARLNSDGSRDASFNVGLGFNQFVLTSTLQTDGKVILGGGFSTYNGTDRRGVIRLNTDGSIDLSFDPGTGVDPGQSVATTSIQTDGKVIIGGNFTTINGTSRSRIARLNSDGSIDLSFDPGTGATGGGFAGSVSCSSIQSDGKILIGGGFVIYDGTSRKGIVRMNSDGSIDTSFDPGTGATNFNPQLGVDIGAVATISVQSDGKYVIGGSFTAYNGNFRDFIARINSDGFIDTVLSVLKTVDQNVSASAIQGDGRIIISGQFTTYNGSSSNRIVRLMDDGTLDASFNVGTGADGTISEVVLQSDGKILICGDFTSYNGTTRNRIARLNADGSIDASFNPGAGATDNVYTMVLQADGKIIIGGSFISFDGTTSRRIARLNSDGSRDASFNVGLGFNQFVLTSTLQTDGKVILGGGFSTYNGTDRRGVIRLNTDGSIDLSFDPGTGVDPGQSVATTSIQTDGKVIIGGNFTTINGTSRSRIARLNTDGSIDLSFDPGTGATGGGFAGSVSCSSIQSDGKILIGGGFVIYDGTNRKGIVRMNSDGSIDTSFDPGTGATNFNPQLGVDIGAVATISVQSDGKYVIGGSFTAYNGNFRDFIARLNGDCNNTSSTDFISVCDSLTWIDGNTYTSSNNTATFIVPNAAGCDSIISLDLTVNYSTNNTQFISACDSFTWIDGITYTASNTTATYLLTGAQGCDSLINLNLNLNYSPTRTDVVNACDFYTWIDGNTYFSNNNAATYTVPIPFACDSIITLDLTLNYSSFTTDLVTACDSFTWVNGVTYYAPPIAAEQYSLTSSTGCDSIVTLDLTILNSTAGTDVQTACDSYAWIDGNTYTASNNTATWTLTNAAGCDSIVTLDLTINNSTAGTDVQTACDSYAWIDGNTYTASNNTATWTLTNAAGCDSIVTLDLTINNSTAGTDVQTACDSYAWIDGNTYTASNNTATWTLTNAAGCDSIVTLDLTINNSSTGVDVRTACDSYTWIDGNTYTSSNSTATHTLTNTAGCDSIVTLNLTINNSSTGVDVRTACDSYTWIDGNTYTSSNSTATHILTNAAGCDSIVTLDLTINNSSTGIDVITACDSYTWIDGNIYTTSNNTATFTLTNAAGCDSIVTLNLTINNSSTGVDVLTACDSYTWIDGNTYTSSNSSATHTLTNAAGCDSIATLNLTISTFAAGTDVITACDTYMWIDGNTYTSSNNTATFTITGGSVSGCDSIVSLDLTINNSTSGSETVAACDTYTWSANTTTYTTSGTYTATLTNAAGCDSTATLNLTINNSTSGSESVTACNSYTWSANTTTYTTSGTYTATLTNVAGCDSIVTLNLTINNSTSGSENVTACDTYTWSANTTTYTTSGTYTATLTNAAGCDSTATLNLTINNATSGSENVTACNSYTWSANTTTYTTSGTYTATLTNVAGCDSIVTLNLTINNSTSGSENVTACDTYTWSANTTTYTTSGTYTATLTNAAGCDSTATLNLTINNATSGSENVTACNLYTWSANTTTYTTSGTYTATLTNAAGCDSVATLNLTINNSTSGSENVTVCDTYTWSANTTMYTTSGTYTATLTNAAGCDSVATLNLTINNSTSGSENVTACNSYTWSANTTTYTTSGTYTATLTNAAGCDSTATLNLTINNSTSGSESVTACNSYTWSANTTTYTTSGTYTATLTNAAGCDSVATLNLTINNSSTGVDVRTACDSYTWIDGNTYTSSNSTATHTLINAAGCDSIVTLDLTINTLNLSISIQDNILTANAIGANYQWIDCQNGNQSISGETFPSFEPSSNGNYACIISEGVCSDTTGCEVITTIGLEDLPQFEFSIAPNPSTYSIQIISDLKISEILIFNLAGQQVVQTNKKEIYVEEFPPGVYLITATTEIGSITKRFIKK